MPEPTLSVLDGSTFVVGDRLGDVRADEGREHGFFSEDTRFISRWVLRVGATPLELLSLNQSAHFDAQLLFTPRHLHETNHLRVALEIDSDLADLFEVKDGVTGERAVTDRYDAGSLTLAYRARRISPLDHDRQQFTGDGQPRRL